MRNLLAVIRMEVASAFEYRLDVLLFVLSGIATPLVLLAIWLAAQSSGAQVPFTRTDFIQYYLLLMVVDLWVGSWSAPFIAAAIRYGKLSPYLLKPLDYFIKDLGSNIGEKLMKSAYILPLFFGLLWLFGSGLPNLTLWEWSAFFISFILAILSGFTFVFCMGLAAFWLDDISGLDNLFDLTASFLSGKLFPLVLLPTVLRDLAVLLPFRYMLSFPLEIAQQRLSINELISGFIFQISWLILMILGYHILWKLGLKKYSAVGA